MTPLCRHGSANGRLATFSSASTYYHGWEIPGDNGCNHSERLPERNVEVIWRVQGRLAIRLLDLASEEIGNVARGLD